MARRFPPDIPSDLNVKKYGPLAVHVYNLWKSVKDLAGGDPKKHAITHQVGGADPLLLPGAPATLRLNLVADTGGGPGFAREDHVHVVDALLNEKGAILSHNGTIYVKVAPGVPNAGDVLTWDPAQPASFKWAAPSGGGGGGSAQAIFDLVENIDVAAPATSVTFSTGVDGDTDEVYVLLYKIIKNTAAVMLTTIRPNGVTTNQLTAYNYNGLVGGAPVSAAVSVATMQIGTNGQGNGSVEEGQLWLAAKTGTRRLGNGQWSQSDVANTLLYLESALHWTDTATNITSIDVVADVASGIGIGSYFRLYKVRKVAPAAGAGSDTFANTFMLMGA